MRKMIGRRRRIEITELIEIHRKSADSRKHNCNTSFIQHVRGNLVLLTMIARYDGRPHLDISYIDCSQHQLKTFQELKTFSPPKN